MTRNKEESRAAQLFCLALLQPDKIRNRCAFGKAGRVSLFDDFASRLGGAYYPAPTDELSIEVERIKRLLRRTQSSNYVRPAQPIEFGLINSGEFNAAAGIERGTDSICLYLGTLHILQSLFFSILSHPQFFQNVGDPSKEKDRTLFNPNAYRSDPAGQFSELVSFMPIDPVRKLYASNLAWIARLFILEHEFCHLYNGHIDWLNQMTGLNMMAEIGASDILNLRNTDLQTLEMDADCYGATHTLLGIFRSDTRTLFNNHPNFEKAQDILFAIQFALYCTFRLFHNESLDPEQELLGHQDHPPAFLRQFIIGATIASRITDNKSISGVVAMDQYSQNFSHVFEIAESAFDLLSGEGKQLALFPKGIIEKSQAASNILAKNWKILRIELLPFKRGDRLAE